MSQMQDPDWIVKISRQVRETFNGASLTELYSQYGIIKRNKQLKLGTNNPEGINGWDTRRQNEQLSLENLAPYLLIDTSGLGLLIAESLDELKGIKLTRVRKLSNGWQECSKKSAL